MQNGCHKDEATKVYFFVSSDGCFIKRLYFKKHGKHVNHY